MSFLSFSDHLIQDSHIIFQKGGDIFEIENKNVQFWFGVQFPLIVKS